MFRTDGTDLQSPGGNRQVSCWRVCVSGGNEQPSLQQSLMCVINTSIHGLLLLVAARLPSGLVWQSRSMADSQPSSGDTTFVRSLAVSTSTTIQSWRYSIDLRDDVDGENDLRQSKTTVRVTAACGIWSHSHTRTNSMCIRKPYCIVNKDILGCFWRKKCGARWIIVHELCVWILLLETQKVALKGCLTKIR